MSKYQEEYEKYLAAKKAWNGFLAEYKKSFPFHKGDQVVIKETGKTIVLDPPFIDEANGDWRFHQGFAITNTGQLSRIRTKIKREWHMIHNGVEYSCSWRNEKGEEID